MREMQWRVRGGEEEVKFMATRGGARKEEKKSMRRLEDIKIRRCREDEARNK